MIHLRISETFVESRSGGEYCFNDGCVVVGHRRDFRVCSQCKTARQGFPPVHFSAQPEPFMPQIPNATTQRVPPKLLRLSQKVVE